ncbi:hypothetical protein BD408DRAFT_418454 [Parasitella parasitica]|nr:hypothetical protein BD408DRAFT_418454 [Parasitella parasitica]
MLHGRSKEVPHKVLSALVALSSSCKRSSQGFSCILHPVYYLKVHAKDALLTKHLQSCSRNLSSH